MRAILAIAGLMLLSGEALADCVCRCVGGEIQPLCSSTQDIPTICPPRMCSMAPPSIAPIRAPTIPPIGTSGCRQRQVQSPYTGQYQWRQVCE